MENETKSKEPRRRRVAVDLPLAAETENLDVVAAETPVLDSPHRVSGEELKAQLRQQRRASRLAAKGY